MNLAERTRRIRPSGIRRMFELAATLADPVDLSIGQPDFDVPEPIREAAIRAIRAGNSRYTVTQGIPALNERVRALARERHGFDPGASLITAGVSGGLLLSCLALLDPGDEILIPDPYFLMYRVAAEIAGARAVCYDTYPDFKLTRAALANAVSERTRVLLLNSPSNPAGHVLAAEELAVAAEFARAHGLTVLSDEIYDSFIYDGPHSSIASLHPETVLLGGFSKSYGMPGWRIGYAVGPPEVVEAMKTLQQFTYVCANSIAQQAALSALDHDMSEQRAAYRRKRDRVVAGLAPAFELVSPGGAFYAFPRVPRGGSGGEFAERALARKLLIVPGTAFSGRDTHFRLSFAAADRDLERGLALLNELAEG